jgi:hypothetical protein
VWNDNSKQAGDIALILAVAAIVLSAGSLSRVVLWLLGVVQ